VTLEGSNLDSVATVRFGGAEGSVAVDNPDQITGWSAGRVERVERGGTERSHGSAARRGTGLGSRGSGYVTRRGWEIRQTGLRKRSE
ncbi:hypothetical protein C5C33_17820, partial [Rathayibacter sp. AY1H3]